jgi:hypothetical protein
VGEARVAVETDVVAHYGFPLGKISECGGEYWVGRYVFAVLGEDGGRELVVGEGDPRSLLSIDTTKMRVSSRAPMLLGRRPGQGTRPVSPRLNLGRHTSLLVVGQCIRVSRERRHGTVRVGVRGAPRYDHRGSGRCRSAELLSASYGVALWLRDEPQGDPSYV